MATEILSNKQYLAGILNPEVPSGKGTIIEYVVLTTLGDCVKESFNFPYDLTSKKYGEINVKSSSKHNSKNGHEWAFGKQPNSYIPDYFICVGLDDSYTEILHVWIIPGNARVIGSHGLHVIDNPSGLKRVAKYEVDPCRYNEAFQSIDFTSFPEFCNTGNTDLIKEFLIDKCIELEQAAKGNNVETFFNDDYKDFYLRSDIVVVYFSHDRDGYTRHLPLDILFDPDFKEKMIKQFEEARENARKQQEEIEKKEEERQRQFEISKLKELMRKYPEIVGESGN